MLSCLVLSCLSLGPCPCPCPCPCLALNCIVLYGMYYIGALVLYCIELYCKMFRRWCGSKGIRLGEMLERVLTATELGWCSN